MILEKIPEYRLERNYHAVVYSKNTGIYQIQRPDGTIDLPRSETQVSSKRAGVFMEYFESIVYHGHYGNRVFTYVSSEEYTELSLYLMSGQVLFNFMNISTHQALGAITGNAALLKKTYLPKYVFTVSKITSGLIDCIFSLERC